MKALKRIEKWEEFDFQIKEATLLSSKEFKKYKHIIPLLNERWWLRSPGYDITRTVYIYYFSDIFEFGRTISSSNDITVRPALKIKVSNLEYLKVGDKLDILDKKWTVLDILEDYVYILCDGHMGYHRFDTESNNWETSELKKFIEDKFEVNVNE